MVLRRETKQKRVILEEIEKSTNHPTARDIYNSVRQQLPRISLGTVYRNMDLLVREGKIKRLDSGGREAHFDADLSEHHHVTCVSCGRIDDLATSQELKVISETFEQKGWVIHERRVEFLGVCPVCRTGGAGGR
jgi:Fur family ferric uptake transcriptional regulator